MIYFAAGQRPLRSMSIVVRTTDATSLASGIRRAVASLDPSLAPPPLTVMSDLVRDAFNTRRFALVLFGIFAGVATLLAGIGIYGVMSYSVTQRTHELGIRIALGAKALDVLKLILGRGLALTLTGIALGLVASFALTRFLSSLLFGISATDPVTFGGLSLLLTLVALVACYLPTRRAMKVDPMVALRNE